MRKVIYALALLLTIAAIVLMVAPAIHAQSAAARTGIWRATLDGVPSVTLTLADDTGALDGAVVFYSVNGKTQRAMSIEPHTLLHPKLDGDVLTFQVRRPDARRITFMVDFTAPTRATIHCLDCSPDAPTAELTKETL